MNLMKYSLFIITILGCNSSNSEILTSVDSTTTENTKPRIEITSYNYDSIFRLSEEIIKADKNFNYTYSCKLTNNSKRIITNVLFTNGIKNQSEYQKAMRDNESEYKEINKEVNLRPGDSVTLHFKIQNSTITEMILENECVIRKIRFVDGKILEVKHLN